MDQEIAIRLGVPAGQAAGATRLYCEAFVDKLAPFLGAADRAAPFLAASFVGDRAFVAHRDGAVMGIAGFKLAGKGLFAPSFRQFVREYGLSALVRWAGLVLLERNEEPQCLLMDGIAVADDARGRGLGTRLLSAIEDHARSLGKTSIRLDVIDTNPGARRLYERLGFKAVKTVGVGPLRPLFPFRATTTMKKTLAP